jgi:hypothetical protein
MKPLLQQAVLVAMLVAAVIGGAVAFGFPQWKRGTAEIDKYIDMSEKPDEEMSNRRWRHVVRSQRRARRLRRTVLWAALGALIGLVAVFAFALFKRR